MKFRISLLVTAVVLMFATFSQAENCTAGIIDKAGVIRNNALIGSAARPLVNQGVDVRIVTVDHNTFVNNGSSLAGVESYFESTCPNWTTAGTRKANLFVVMVAPTDRQKNIFLGSYYAGSFDIPSTYSNFANASFKAGQWETGIANTLNGTGNRAVAYHQQQFAAQQRQRVVPVQPQQRVYTQTPVYNQPTPQTADSGMSGVLIFFLVLLVVSIVILVLYFVFRDSTDTSTTMTSTDYGPSNIGYSTPSVSSNPRRYAAAAPSTVVVHEHYDSSRYDSSGNLLTGILIGEALSRPSQPTYINNPAPVYVEPTPSYTPDPAPVTDAPDSTWSDPAPAQADAPDTNFETPTYEAPSEPSYTPDPPSSDFGSSGGDQSF